MTAFAQIIKRVFKQSELKTEIKNALYYAYETDSMTKDWQHVLNMARACGCKIKAKANGDEILYTDGNITIALRYYKMAACAILEALDMDLPEVTTSRKRKRKERKMDGDSDAEDKRAKMQKKQEEKFQI